MALGTPKSPTTRLMVTDHLGGAMTLHAAAHMVGLVVSDKDHGAANQAAVTLDRADRAALIAALIKLQEEDFE